MKEYVSRTVEDCINNACMELGIPTNHLLYKVIEEKSGLFKKARIEVYTEEDAIIYAQEYLTNTLGAMGVDIAIESTVEENVIRININSKRNPVLIGKSGRTLQALNELTRLAVSNKFRHRYRILLDVGGYKEDRYSRIAYLAKRAAEEVVRTKYPVQLDPMTPDERRVVHNVLTGWKNIKTESSGEGSSRAVNIFYVE